MSRETRAKQDKSSHFHSHKKRSFITFSNFASTTDNFPLGVRVRSHRLTSMQGLTEETVYTWDFGDESDEVEIKGLEAAGTQRHTYASDGHYTVRVTASNEGGRNSIVIDVTVGSKREACML